MNHYYQYYKKYPLTNPAYMVARISGNEIRDRAEKYFSGRMIEIGCGDKSKKYLVGDLVTAHIGLDHEGTLHDKASVDLFGTAYHIPQDDSSYHCLLSTAVLEHLEDPQAALREAFRVLHSGGYAIYTAPLYWHLHEEPRDYYRYTKYGLEHLFKTAGFEIIEITPLSGFWITFGTELNYYFSSIGSSFLFLPLRLVVVFINFLFPLFNQIDIKKNKNAEKWTWMYLVVAKKR